MGSRSLALILLITAVLPAFADEFPLTESRTCREFSDALEQRLEEIPSEREQLETLYALLDSLRDNRISHSLDTFYGEGSGERPAASILDRNLRYTLFIEAVWERIDRIKIAAAEALKETLAPLPGLSDAVRREVETLADLNGAMGEAVTAAEESFNEMLELRNDYQEVLELQREVMRAALKTRGPRVTILTGIGASGGSDTEAALTGEAGFLYHFGPVGLGVTARSSLDLNQFGVGLVVGFNIQ